MYDLKRVFKVYNKMYVMIFVYEMVLTSIYCVAIEYIVSNVL